jgi:hypothetical protein
VLYGSIAHWLLEAKVVETVKKKEAESLQQDNNNGNILSAY